MKYNFCKNCGSPVQPGMPICQRCGAPVDQIQPVDENKPMAQPPGMLRQYYGDNSNNNQPNSNMAQAVQPQQMNQPPMGQPMDMNNNMQQPMNGPMNQQQMPQQMNQPPMGQPIGMNNNMQQPMNGPMNQQQMPQQMNQPPMGQPMNGPMPMQQPVGKDNSIVMGIGGIICAAVAFITVVFLAFGSLALGIFGIKTAKVSNNNTGKALCIASIVLGFVDIVLFILRITNIFVIEL